MPTRTVTATVTERTIALDRKHVTQNNVSIDRLVLALDAEWEGCDDVKVMFYQDGASVLVDYAEGGIDFPAEIVANLETLRLTVLGYFANGDRIVTKKMSAADAITVDESGMLEAQGAVEATKDAYQRLFEAAGNIDASEASAKTSMEAAREAAVSAQASANALAGAPWSGNVPKATVSGSLVHVEDAYPSPVVEARVEGRSSQGGEGIAAPNLVTAGENLLPFPYRSKTGPHYGVDWEVNEDGTVAASGEVGDGFSAFFLMGTKDGYDGGDYFPPGTYTASCGLDNGGSSSWIMRVQVCSEGLIKSVNDIIDSAGKTFKVEPGDRVVMMLQVRSGYKANNLTYKPRISAGTAVSPYSQPATRYEFNLKGEELCSLPDGTCDELVVDAAGNYGILKRVGVDEEAYVPLGTIDEAVRLPEKTSNVWVEAGKDTTVSVTYARDVNDILAALEALLHN